MELSRSFLINEFLKYTDWEIQEVSGILREDVKYSYDEDELDYCFRHEALKKGFSYAASLALAVSDLGAFGNEELMKIAKYCSIPNLKHIVIDAEDEEVLDPCKICGEYTIEDMGDICPICSWESGPITENGMSLVNSDLDGSPSTVLSARHNWLKVGKPLSSGFDNSDFVRKLFTITKAN